MEDQLLNYSQVAELTSLRLGTLYALVHARRIPCVRFGPRLVRFRRSEIIEWLASRSVPVTGGAQ